MMDFKPLTSLFILLTFALVQPVYADGVIVSLDPDMMEWRLQDEELQLCAINYENGYQNMLLSVGLRDMANEKAVWIFPVPAKPAETTVDIIKGFPQLQGVDIEESAERKISTVFTNMRLSQVYALPIILFRTAGHLQARATGIEGVTIHERQEQLGLTTELITAEDGDSFYHYLADKGLDMPPDSKSILDDYTGKEYSFVVSWISDAGAFIEEFETGEKREGTLKTISVFISFPTPEIYFPLKPTSVYGDQRIPIAIYVMDYVSPGLYPGIKKASQVSYYSLGSYDVPGDLSSFFNGKDSVESLKYTKIRIDTPSKYLTEDLWIKDSPPARVVFADFIDRHHLMLGIVIFALSSCLASMFAGMVVFEYDRPSKFKFAVFGLSNFLTLLGLAAAAYLLRIDNRFTESKEVTKTRVGVGRLIDRGLRLSLIGPGALLLLRIAIELFHWAESGHRVSFFFDFFTYVNAYFLMFFLIVPSLWAYYHNRKIAGFVLLFTISFQVITLFFQVFLRAIV